MKDKIIRGMFISIWSDGTVIDAPATLNEKTGEVFTSSIDNEINAELEEEFFESEDGSDKYEICQICHEFIKKPQIIEGVGKQLNEVNMCMNGCND
jgi:hypothetical protein